MKRISISRKQALQIGLLAAVSTCGYLIYSESFYRIGFPLDDSWIHQTYARNLAEYGEWSFTLGEASSGATSPLWAILISVGYALGIQHFVWTFFLGWLFLWANGLTGMMLFQALVPKYGQLAKWVGVVIVLDWHFVWAAVSGMEILLFSSLVMGTFAFLISMLGNEQSSRSFSAWVLLGSLCGLSVCIRPEGLILFGIAVAGILTAKSEWRSRIQHFLASLGGLAVPTAPYLLFNYRISNLLWPTTFYAKQAEYTALQTTPFITRAVQQGGVFVVGVGIALLPGFLIYIYRTGKDRRWVNLLPAGWIALHIIIYALRLPVIYQHGRYMMPAMPVFIVYGSAGLICWMGDAKGRLAWILRKSWSISAAAILVIFYFLGGRSYALDVAVIESEMVTTARWIAENTRASDLIAAHDIGALGYFSGRKIIDLAGLVSPEVVPFIRDETRLMQYLDESGASYLVCFPSLYPNMVASAAKIYDTGGKFSPSAGGENMAVFRWQEP